MCAKFGETTTPKCLWQKQKLEGDSSLMREEQEAFRESKQVFRIMEVERHWSSEKGLRSNRKAFLLIFWSIEPLWSWLTPQNSLQRLIIE